MLKPGPGPGPSTNPKPNPTYLAKQSACIALYYRAAY